MEYEVGRHCETSVGWTDPRSEEGELAWPERFPEASLAPFKRLPYMWAGQYQQRPEPRGGGIFKRDWWQEWEPPDGKFPLFDYVVASLDTAYTEKQQNDPSALTMWGAWRDAKDNRKIMLLHAWRERLELHPLVEKVAATCRRFKIDRLLIEAKASGLSVAQEIQRLYANELWGVELINPKAQDKVARAYAVQHLFSDGLIYAPDRAWATMVQDEMASFPKATHDDLTDTATQALKHLRDIGLAVRRDEHQMDMNRMMEHRRKPGPLYPV
jgi:predicted phage terminase large subunit-like protein